MNRELSKPHIILVRHAIAADRVPGIPDTDRALTKKGVRLFEAMLPQALDRLGGQRLMLWASPALRAQQTARMLAQAFAVQQVDLFDFILTGGWPQLMDAVRMLSPVPDALLIVGHQPHLTEWALHLSGQEVPFRKGEMACFDNPSGTGTGRLLWRITPA